MSLFGKKPKTQSKRVRELGAQQDTTEKELTKLRAEFEAFKRENLSCIQRVGVVRFNPFQEQGGDQSFSIALLDGHGNGFVVTSIYGRGENRIYAKPVQDGKSEYTLSPEEQQAITEAQGGKK